MKLACFALLALCVISVNARRLRNGERVHLKTCHGRHLSSPNKKTINQVDQPGEHEVFFVSEQNGKFGLRTWHNHYMSARDNGQVTLMPWMKEWEQFKVLEHPDRGRKDHVKFRTWRKTHLFAHDRDHLGQAPGDGKCEWFEVISAPDHF